MNLSWGVTPLMIQEETDTEAVDTEETEAEDDFLEEDDLF